MRMTNLSEAMQIITVIPGETGGNTLIRPLCIELGEPHPDDKSRPARVGMPSPSLDLVEWCKANKARLGELSEPKALIAHLRKSRAFTLSIEGKRDASGAVILAPEIGIA